MQKRFASLILAVIFVFLSVPSAMAAGTYTVKSGDVLWKIAQNNNTTWQRLAEINKLANPHLIFPGQVLKLEEKQTASVVPAVTGGVVKSAEAQGFGGVVTVTVTVKDGTIVAVTAAGDKETPALGGRALEIMPAAMVKANSVDVDTVSGASHTSEAILSAAKQAYNEAIGKNETAAVNMSLGTYTGKGTGYHLAYGITAKVTVSKDAIQSIELVDTDVETMPIRQAVIDKFIPRVIEHQSTAVDAITGATGTSNGVRTAVNDALAQALEKGGSPAAALSAFQIVPKKPAPVTKKIETGVLVVGMGGSGTASAMRAVETMYAKDPKSVSVLAIDKAGKYGGTSALTSEMMSINPPKHMEVNNGGKAYVDKAVMRADWLKYTEGDAKTDLVDIMLDNSGKALDWLMTLGFNFVTKPQRGFTAADVYDTKFPYANQTPTASAGDKAITGTYYDSLYKKYTELGGKYMLETEAYDLIYDTASNTVKGVKARDYLGAEYEIYADSVVLATGGFAGNGEMETKYLGNTYYPLKGAWKLEGSYQNDGKMIQSALNIGAGTYNISIPPMVHMSGTTGFLTGFEIHYQPDEYAMFHRGKAAWSAADLPMSLLTAANGLAVDPNGKRFTAESGLGMLDPWKAGPLFYGIVSDEKIQEVKAKGITGNTGFALGPIFLGHMTPIPANTPLPEANAVMEAAIKAGFVYKADTLSELAAKIGVDPKTLETTVATYNEYAKTGDDKEFGKAADMLEAIGAGPYYAIEGSPYSYSTCGGLDIDKNFNVLKTDGKTPINNLYAVGTDSMGVLFTEKKAYVTYGGAAQGWAYTSGYVAGEIAANNSLSK